MKHFASLALVVAFVVLFAASATQKHMPIATKQTFTFDYKTLSPARPGSANVTISLVRSHYAERLTYYNNIDIFANFQNSFEKDVEELLVDKGFRIKGPYQSFDEMVFNDKKDADIAIEIEIEPRFTAADGGWRGYVPFQLVASPTTQYYYSGTVSLTGKINMVGYEPLSHEKIWVKSVEIPNIVNIDVSTARRDFDRPVPGTDAAFLNDVNVYNALGNAFKAQYNGILAKMDAHFDPQEFVSLKPQIKELKSKKGY